MRDYGFLLRVPAGKLNITHLKAILPFLAALFFAMPGQAAIVIQSLQVTEKGAETEIRLRMDSAARYQTLRVQNPERLVLDVTDARLARPNTLAAAPAVPLIHHIRAAQFDPHTLRIVFDLAQPAALVSQGWIASGGKGALLSLRLRADGTPPIKGAGTSFLVPPSPPLKLRGSRAVAPKPELETPKASPVPTPNLKDSPFATPPIPKLRPERQAKRPSILVAIDAGHGGQDPGAIGPDGSHEKDITFAIAKAVKSALLASGHYKAYLTRSDDSFVLLRDRIVRARKAKADLFISIHADSAPGGEARGLSVYTLSDTASDKQAELLAKKENQVDILSGMDMEVDNKEVADILIDLVRRETRTASMQFADAITTSMQASGVRLLQNPHRYAGFAVLKAPDIPSVLVETGFISNAQEEKLLSSAPYRDRLARAIVAGIDRYQAAKAKPNR